MHWSSPRAKAGFIMLAASICPAWLPAPTRLCISSINTMMLGFSFSSLMMVRIRSSNCPLYFVPATTVDISRDTILLSKRIRDTLRLIIRSASPSTMALFPTPGSPINTGLFFFRDRIWAMRSISFSRPTTGSSFPSLAALVISVPKASIAGVSVSFCLLLVAFAVWLEPLPRLDGGASSSSSSSSKSISAWGVGSLWVRVANTLLYEMPLLLRNCMAGIDLYFISPNKMCSDLMLSLFCNLASSIPSLSMFDVSSLTLKLSSDVCDIVCDLRLSSRLCLYSWTFSRKSFWRIRKAWFSPSRIMPRTKCSGSILVLWSLIASSLLYESICFSLSE